MKNLILATAVAALATLAPAAPSYAHAPTLHESPKAEYAFAPVSVERDDYTVTIEPYWDDEYPEPEPNADPPAPELLPDLLTAADDPNVYQRPATVFIDNMPILLP